MPDALDFSQRGLQLEEPQVVQAAQRDHQVEVLVAEGIGVLGAIAEEIAADALGGVGQAVPRDVEAHARRIRQQLLQLVEQVRLAAADVEDLGVRAARR